APPQCGSVRSFLTALIEQAELRRIARWLRQPELAEGVTGQQAAARRALQEALLDQKRLDDLLDCVARLGERRRDGLDADWPTAVVERYCGEITPVHRVEPGSV